MHSTAIACAKTIKYQGLNKPGDLSVLPGRASVFGISLLYDVNLTPFYEREPIISNMNDL
jgi:hypothetical protein